MADENLKVTSIGKVVSIEGSVQAKLGEEIRQLSPDSKIFQGDTLSTGPDGKVEILFQDNTTLTMGTESRLDISNYVYDNNEPSASNLLFELSKGVFRTVTGEIADQNPDHFKLQSPLATIGIRGTTVVSEVKGEAEKHGVEDIGPGKVLVVMDNMGNIQFIDNPGLILDVFQNQNIQPARPLTEAEEAYFRSATIISDETDSDADPDDETDAGGDEAGTDPDDTDQDSDNESTGDGTTGDQGVITPLIAESLSYKVLGIIDSSGADGVVFHAVTSDDEENSSNEDSDNTELYDPVAADDNATTEQGTAVVIDVISNDTDPDGDALSVTAIGQPSMGTVKINDDGTLTYTPDSDASGTDTFTYTVGDGSGGTSSGTVTVEITAPQNQDPVAADDNATTEQDTAVVIDVISNDTDPDGDALSVTAIGQPSMGTVTLNDDGTLTYTPDSGASGTDTFTYTVGDGSGGTSSGTVSVTIADSGDESIIGTAGNDTLYGHKGDDTISGDDGDDTIYGDTPGDETVSGSDILYGGGGDDLLRGGPGNDSLYGGQGKDILIGGQGSDSLDGGDFDSEDFFNRVSYGDDDDYNDDGYGISGGIVYSYSNGASSFSGSYITDGWGDTDTLTGVSGIYGSDYADNLTVQISNSDDKSYCLWSLSGGAGDDTLTGTSGERVAAVYYDSTSSVGIDLGNGSASDGLGGTDTLVNIQVAIGSIYNDTIVGSEGKDEFFGTLGDDTIQGLGGNDVLSYSWRGDGLDDFSAVEINLSEGCVYGKDASLNLIFTDTISSIEAVQGSVYNDTITGSSDADIFLASLGDDTIDGQDSELDTVDFSNLEGQEDFDHVVVDLSSYIAYGLNTSNGTIFTDNLVNVEDVYGSSGDDSIRGSEADNMLSGGDGNDTLNGDADGIDTLTGGKGADVFEISEYQSPDYISDFSTSDSDLIRFLETDMGTNVSSDGSLSVYTTTATGTGIDPTQYQVVGITDAIGDWSDALTVADFINSAVEDYKMTNGNTDDTYFLIHNGTDGRIYYWDGDEDHDYMVDTDEIDLVVTLEGVDSVDNFADSNFEFA